MRRWMLAACAALTAPVGAADEPVFTLGTVTVEAPAAGRMAPASSVVDLDEPRANDRETVGAALTPVPGAHLEAGYEFGQGLLLGGGVRNPFDRLCAYAERFPGPGRTLFVQGKLPF